jgi:hypothetical protein
MAEFLVVPAALLGAMSCIDNLGGVNVRSTTTWLSRGIVLGKAGLHELCLPSDYVLGLFLLRTEGGTLGKIIASRAEQHACASSQLVSRRAGKSRHRVNRFKNPDRYSIRLTVGLREGCGVGLATQ